MLIPPPYELGPYAAPVVFARVLAQSVRMRRILPRLPEARGPRRGVIGHGARILRVALVGESSVAGVGAAYHRTGLAGGVASGLAHAFECCVDWRAYGRSGLNAARLRQEIVPGIESEPVDAIVLAIGANDAMELTPRKTWQRELESLLGAVRERLGSAPIVIGRAPPFECSPTLPELLRRFLGYRCRRINAATAAFLAGRSDVRLSSEPIRLSANDFAADGFHPNEISYARLGRHLAQCLIPMLQGFGRTQCADGALRRSEA